MLSCFHYLSTTSPTPPPQSLLLGFPLPVERQCMSSREWCAAQALCFQSPPVPPPNFPRIHFLGPPPPSSLPLSTFTVPAVAWPRSATITAAQDHRVLEAKVGDPTTSRTRISSSQVWGYMSGPSPSKNGRRGCSCPAEGGDTGGENTWEGDSTRPGQGISLQTAQADLPAHSTTPTCSSSCSQVSS